MPRPPRPLRAELHAYQPLIDRLARGVRPCLHRLHIGAYRYPEETEISWVTIGSIEALWTALPDLEDLRVTGGGIELGAVIAPKLTRLMLETGGLPSGAAQSLGRAVAPKLRDLQVWFGMARYGGGCSAEDIRALLANRTGLPAVKRLGLMNWDGGDALCEAVLASDRLADLVSLDLSMGTMSDFGARLILDNAERFVHLEFLNLELNCIGAEMAAALVAEVPNATLYPQRQPRAELYTSVGE